MTIDLVTGGAGFIGSHLVDRLVGMGRRVRVVDNLASGQRRNLAHHSGNPAFELIEADIADSSSMLRAAAGVERVFHLGALADIVPSIRNPDAYFRSNVDGTYATLQAARAADVGRFVYVASSSCYGLPDVFPTPEDAPIRPQYPYALSKWLGECLVMHWAQVYRLPAVSLRFFNIYGPRARTSGTYGAVFGVFLAQMLAGKPLTIVGDGEQERDFTYVSDAVDALLAAAGSDRVGRCYNVGSDQPITINRLAGLLNAGDRVHIPKRPGEPDRTFADTRRIKTELRWRASVPIEEGVGKMLESIEYWRDAPVWTPGTIAAATADWFKYLGKSQPEGRQDA
jgi:UDP-glucose 4-epimerase